MSAGNFLAQQSFIAARSQHAKKVQTAIETLRNGMVKYRSIGEPIQSSFRCLALFKFQRAASSNRLTTSSNCINNFRWSCRNGEFTQSPNIQSVMENIWE